MRMNEATGFIRRLAQIALVLSLGAGGLFVGPAQGQTPTEHPPSCPSDVVRDASGTFDAQQYAEQRLHCRLQERAAAREVLRSRATIHAETLASTVVLAQDSLALVAFYNSTDGPNWLNRSNWLIGPVRDWWGVEVDQNRVTQLNLPNNQLSGNIPPEIGNLTNLEFLTLPSNQLSGSIPPEIGNLTRLRGLVLDFNQLSGSIPPEIGDLRGLEALYLNDNRLRGSIPPEVRDLHFLFAIRIQNNQITNLPDLSDLGEYTSLDPNIYVHNNRLTFEDLEPNIDKLSSYAPQARVGMARTDTVHSGERLVFSISVGGQSNQYQWYKDGTPIPGAQGNIFAIFSASPADAGSYVLHITNPRVPHLTLESEPITVVFGATTDATPPACEIVELAPRSHLSVQVHDPESGLATITVLKHTNASISHEAFTPGTQQPVTVTATKTQPDQKSVVVLEVTDVAGNSTRCDPVLTTLIADGPARFRLETNYPNPFNPSTQLRFEVAEPVYVRLAIYDLLGREVTTLVEGTMEPGAYEAE